MTSAIWLLLSLACIVGEAAEAVAVSDNGGACNSGSVLSSNKVDDASLKAKFAPGQTLSQEEVCKFTQMEVNFDWPEEGKIFRIMSTSAGGDAAKLGFAMQYYLQMGCAYTSSAQNGSNIDRCSEAEPARRHLFSMPEEMNGYRLAPLPITMNASDIRHAHFNCILERATGCSGPLSQYVEWVDKYKNFNWDGQSDMEHSVYASITFEHGPKIQWDNGEYGGWEAVNYRTYILLFLDAKDCDSDNMIWPYTKDCSDLGDTVWLVPVFVDADPVRGGFYDEEEYWMKLHHPRPESASVEAQAWAIPEFASAINGMTGATLRDTTSGWVVREMSGDDISPLYTNWPVCAVSSFCPTTTSLADRCGNTSAEGIRCPVDRKVPPSERPAMWKSVELLPACFCSAHPGADSICASVETCKSNSHALVCQPIKCGDTCGYPKHSEKSNCPWSQQPCDACVTVQSLPNISWTWDCGKTISVGSTPWDTCNQTELTPPSTCADVEKLYEQNGCCTAPSKAFSWSGRRLSIASEKNELLASMREVLDTASTSEANDLAQAVKDIALQYTGRDN